MAMLLEAIDGPGVGRAITLRPGRPRILKVVKQGLEAGEITIELSAHGCTVINRSQRALLVNGTECLRSSLRHGDTLVLGKDSFRLIDEEVPIEAPPSDSGYHPSSGLKPTRNASSETDRHRRLKSISASMPAIPTQPRTTLISRMSAVFSVRARTHRGREEELSRERLELLAEAGRQALTGQVFGLPDSVMADLLAGRSVTIAADDLARGALERWRDLTQRVAVIDAEIATLRRQLGLGSDPDAKQRSTSTRGGLREREDRVFASLDKMNTQELTVETADGLTPVPDPLPATSGRRSAVVKGRATAAGRRLP